MGCGASKPAKDEPPEPPKGAPPTLESEPSAGERCHTDNSPPPCEVAEGEATVEAAAEDDDDDEEEEGANIDPKTGEVKRSNSVVDAYAGSSFQEQLAALQTKFGGASESPLEAALAAHAKSAEPEAAADENLVE